MLQQKKRRKRNNGKPNYLWNFSCNHFDFSRILRHDKAYHARCHILAVCTLWNRRHLFPARLHFLRGSTAQHLCRWYYDDIHLCHTVGIEKNAARTDRTRERKPIGVRHFALIGGIGHSRGCIVEERIHKQSDGNGR